MKKIILWVFIILMLLNGGCIEKKTSEKKEDNKADNYLVYDIGKIPEDLKLLKGNDVRGKDLLLLLFEGLVKIDESGNIAPGIAESWTVSEDEMTYTFNLREDVKWSDGTKIKASDFVEFFKSILNPKQDNDYAYQLYYIFGAEDYKNGKKSFDNVAIRAKDDKTLQIRLNYPADYFIKILGQPIYTLRKVNKQLESWRETYNNINYSGAFIIDYVSETGEITLLKNENYYDMYKVKSDKIYVTALNSSEKALAGFKTSKINIFTNPPMGESKNLIIDGEGEAVPIDSGTSINFNLNKDGIIADVNFRKALSLAIDRENLAVENLNNTVKTAAAYLPDGLKEDNIFINRKMLIKNTADTVLSKKFLAESKYVNSKSFKLVYLNTIENKKLCEAVAKGIKEALDIHIDCKGYNESEFQDIIKNSDYDMILTDYTSFYKDSLALLESWVSTSKLNVYGYKNSEFDSLILKAKFEKDKIKRKELLEKVEEILIDDMPMMPLYFKNIVLCKKSNIEGIYITPEGNVKLDRAYVKN
ncbi:peptide ABC transporter substrate-binding protein [Clostridium sp. SYSU_GA19001]|uniref:peptide ABC transporter substrate-binding protein n=1 Tax=Clostridium caldaquaticum TaxID=2940653 RepID=UPI002076ECD9|nr:peptide ABC transporter substrate-binding protein [Clostridium caldaquaticum]MCM8711864.1 peptide ABC transporter substrate-binding protein [Clostridium caldaquaticum]